MCTPFSKMAARGQGLQRYKLEFNFTLTPPSYLNNKTAYSENCRLSPANVIFQWTINIQGLIDRNINSRIIQKLFACNNIYQQK